MLDFMRRLGGTGVLGIMALVLPPLGSIVLFLTMHITGPWLKSHDQLGILVYVCAFALLAGLALLPTYAQSALGGFAFGTFIGVPAALGGFLGASIIGYLIARKTAGDRVEQLINEKPKWRAVRDALMGSRGPAQPGAPVLDERSFFQVFGMVTLLRLPPNSPFALTNLVMASVKVPILPFALGTMVGMLPRTALAVVIGAGVKEFTKDGLEKSTPGWVIIAGIAITFAIVLLIGTIANRAIKRVTQQPAA